mgnify:CR=1 FL=1
MTRRLLLSETPSSYQEKIFERAKEKGGSKRGEKRNRTCAFGLVGVKGIGTILESSRVQIDNPPNFQFCLARRHMMNHTLLAHSTMSGPLCFFSLQNFFVDFFLLFLCRHTQITCTPIVPPTFGYLELLLN